MGSFSFLSFLGGKNRVKNWFGRGDLVKPRVDLAKTCLLLADQATSRPNTTCYKWVELWAAELWPALHLKLLSVEFRATPWPQTAQAQPVEDGAVGGQAWCGCISSWSDGDLPALTDLWLWRGWCSSTTQNLLSSGEILPGILRSAQVGSSRAFPTQFLPRPAQISMRLWSWFMEPGDQLLKDLCSICLLCLSHVSA